ncbi:CBS domain-containing protein [Streptomyces yaizuensis]|uniref:CBS domain-containing protein n=1 Tax=Streptomyces yaizuensis TaxID=2989713 RepID=A0ABQ5NX50_9ACTN|nr:CBS domain-containing protein [Streptomyces sp. YSPA8]GLF94551.1 CBS domain-containing protein [Streptomyces sp. YSPA8]
MLVRDAMSTVVLTIGPAHTLRQAARLMAARRVGAAVVLDGDTEGGPGILTERDVLASVGAGQDPDRETAGTHTTTDVVFAAPSWTLEEAAETMSRGGFRHLIVLDGQGPVGVVSVRDIIRAWAPTRAHRPPTLVG